MPGYSQSRLSALHIRKIGSHQELLAQRGIYWKLYQLQYKDQELGVGETRVGADD